MTGKPNPRRDKAFRTLRTKTEKAIRSRVLAGEPCHLCGQPIDLSLPQTYIDPRDGKRKRAPWSLEIDEVIPVSRGGLPYGVYGFDEFGNCLPAHRVCNQRRGNKPLAPAHVETKAPKPSKDW